MTNLFIKVDTDRQKTQGFKHNIARYIYLQLTVA